MTILLTAPFEQPAMHGQPAATYNEVKIIYVGTGLVGAGKEIAMTCQYGNGDGEGEWQAGIIDTVVHVINNTEVVVDAEGNEVTPADPAYDVFMATTFPTNTTDASVDQNAEALYQHLIDEGIYAGTIT